MALSCAIEEAWENIMGAFSAIEQSGRLYGPNSEEVRLARAAFHQWRAEYIELTEAQG
jgi:hypothetical protein